MTWLTKLTDWACWKAWNYARSRELARRIRSGIEPQIAESDLTLDQRRILANEARQLLENRHLKEALRDLWATVEAEAIACDRDDAEKAHRIVITKQLMAMFERELRRKVEDGYMAEAELTELNRRNAVRVFRR